MTTFKKDDFVWARIKGFPLWPGRIISEGYRRNQFLIQFYGKDDHGYAETHNMFPYLENFEKFTSNPPENYKVLFSIATNTIHEKFWNTVDLKRDRFDSGFPVDTDEEIEIEEENLKAAHWNPRIIRRHMRRNGNEAREADGPDHGLRSDPGPSSRNNPGFGSSSKRKRSNRNKDANQSTSTETKSISPKTSGKKKSKMEISSCQSSKISSTTSTTCPQLPIVLLKRWCPDKTYTGGPIKISKAGKNTYAAADSKVSSSACDTTTSSGTHPPDVLPLKIKASTSVASDPSAVLNILASKKKLQFGFIGLGRLSESLIFPFLENKHVVNVWSKYASKFNKLRKAGATCIHTPAKLITLSDVIFYCTHDPGVSKHILLTREGIFDGCSRSLDSPKLFIEFTKFTEIEPDRSIRPVIAYQKGVYLQMKAHLPQINRKLPPTFIVAGNADVFHFIKPYINYASDTVHYFGREFFKDAPMHLTKELVEDLILQNFKEQASCLNELGLDIPRLESILVSGKLDYQKIALHFKKENEAKRNYVPRFYEDM